MPDTDQLVWVLLPAYNEGAGLADLCRELTAEMNRYNYRLVVVDDGSTDDSIARLQASCPSGALTLLRHGQNQGLGKAIETGLNSICQQPDSSPDAVVVVMDADQTHPPALIHDMLPLLDGHDVVIASRYQPGGQVIGLSFYRRILSTGASWLFRLCIPVPNVRDYTCGFRAYRLSSLQKAFAQTPSRFITERGFTCMAEILVKLAALGCTFAEAPLILRYDRKVSTSKMRLFKTILASLPLLIRHRYRP